MSRADDRLCGKVSDELFDYLIDRLALYPRHFAQGDAEPELLFSRDPDVYPLFVDLGDERFAIEVEVMVTKVTKGAAADGSCSEDEAYPPREASDG